MPNIYSSSFPCNNGSISPIMSPEQRMPPPVLDEDLRDQMQVMFWQENSNYRTSDYLGVGTSTSKKSTPPSPAEKETVMNEQWRSRMCEWAYQCKCKFFLVHVKGAGAIFLENMS
jgi:hypothetical protein